MVGRSKIHPKHLTSYVNAKLQWITILLWNQINTYTHIHRVSNMFQPICIKYPESRQYCLHHHTKVPTGLIFWRLRTCFNNHCNMTHNVHNIPSIYLLLWPVMNNFWKWKDKKWKKGVTFFIGSMTYYYKYKEKWQ